MRQFNARKELVYLLETKITFPIKPVSKETIVSYHDGKAMEHNHKSAIYERMMMLARKKGNKGLEQVYSKLSNHHFAAGISHEIARDLHKNPHATENERNKYTNKAYKLTSSTYIKERKLLDDINNSNNVFHHEKIKKEIERNLS